MNFREVLNYLKEKSDPDRIAGMRRFGINTETVYGVSIPELRSLAKKIGVDHNLAQGLWDSNVHEARILASMVNDPEQVDEQQADRWVGDFNSWDVCDQVCMNLFEDCSFAYEKAFEWAKQKHEFVKRAGFVMMARLAVSDKKAEDSRFLEFFDLIKKESVDERNFVKKAVNWALRQIGKRSLFLNKKTVALAREIQKIDSKSARWIAADALRELQSEAVLKRLR